MITALLGVLVLPEEYRIGFGGVVSISSIMLGWQWIPVHGSVYGACAVRTWVWDIISM